MPAGCSVRTRTQGPSAPKGQPVKRKREAADSGEPWRISGRLRRMVKAADRAKWNWEHQYELGTSEEGVRGGSSLLSLRDLPFQAPFAMAGTLEIKSGIHGKGSGGMQLTALDYFRDDSDESEEGDGESSREHQWHASILVPFGNIEEVFILRNPAKKAPKAEAYRIIIVPTAATGAASVKRLFPQIISFSMPNKATDGGAGGTIGDAADGSKDTYLSVFKDVLNDQLGAFGKTVIDVCTAANTPLLGGKKCIMIPPSSSPIINSDDKGWLYFLETGVLFLSDRHRMYLPFGSASGKVMLVSLSDYAGTFGKPRSELKLVAFKMLWKATEPFYPDKKEALSTELRAGTVFKLVPGTRALVASDLSRQIEQTALICFGNLDSSLLDTVKEYMVDHGVDVQLFTQDYYDYKTNQPVTGFMPVHSAGRGE